MSDSQDELKRTLEYLRLASELMEMARSTVNPELKAHCLRMARKWTERAEQDSPREIGDPGC